MDSEPTPTRKKSSATGAKKTAGARASVKNYSSSPYGGREIPPFDDTPDEPIGEGVFEKLPRQKTSSARRAAAAAKKTTAAKTGKGKSSTKRAGDQASSPASMAYRMQPWLVLGVGALFAVLMLLSALMSGGRFEWTATTHPFRVVGFYTEQILFGLLGVGTYLIPAFMIYLSIRRIRNGGVAESNGRSFLALTLTVLFPAVVHSCMIDAQSAQGALDTWNIKQLYLLGADRLGGGVLGGYLGHLLYLALGVIGTLIVGGALMIVLLMLLFNVTPASIWKSLRAYRLSRRERAREQKEERLVQTQNGQLMLSETAQQPRTKRKEAPASYGPEWNRQSVEQEEDEVYLDPTRALLEQNKKRKRTEQTETQDSTSFKEDEPAAQAFEPDVSPTSEITPDDVFSEDWTMAQSAPIETVNELSPEQVLAREMAYEGSISKATTLSFEEEAEQLGPEGEMVDYPKRAEIDLDASGVSVSPLETPVEDSPEQTLDYQGGFDYSMDEESAEEDESLVDSETVGGVEMRIERLSREERERGQTLAAPEEEPLKRPYVFPTVDLMSEPRPHNANKEQEVRAKMQKLRDTLVNFKVNVDGISYVCGPSVTRYEVRPAPGVRVKAVAGLADDIAMSLAAQSIRIEAPIPGKSAVGIEVPNTTRETVSLRPLIDSDEFRSKKSRVTACLGQDVAGTPILFDIAKMPHLLVAGTTNSGKSVCINSIVMSLLYKSTPEELKFIMIDPKQVEFTVYKDIPHLMAPIVCDAKRAAAVLNLAVLEMEKRFQMIREVGMKNIAGYNEITATDRYEHPYMPYIVIVIDELAELMMQARDEVETSIVRLAQKARAAGMHLIIGTQRPSVDVITGLIKSNVPSRIAFTVASQVDSRTILDNAGAEKLLGMGDMLYAPVGSPKPLRVQGAFVSDDEVERIVNFIKRNNDPVRYDQEFLDNIDREAAMIGSKRQADMDDDPDAEGVDGADPKFYEAVRIAVENKRISTSLLQRMLSIGYGRAAKIIDQMEAKGFVGPAVGNKPREIRITEQAFAELMMNKEE